MNVQARGQDQGHLLGGQPELGEPAKIVRSDQGKNQGLFTWGPHGVRQLAANRSGRLPKSASSLRASFFFFFFFF